MLIKLSSNENKGKYVETEFLSNHMYNDITIIIEY